MAGALGYTPAEVRAMSYKDAVLIADGWAEAHGGGEPEFNPPTPEEYAELKARVARSEAERQAKAEREAQANG